jgi:hypothetical protein
MRKPKKEPIADRNLLFGGDSRRGEGSRERGDLN